MKRLFDEITIEGYPGPLEGKVGGAFTAGGRAGSGAELTLLNVLHILLNHGLIIQGEPFGPHYGPVALGEPTEELFHFCRTWGARWARLVKRLAARAGGMTSGATASYAWGCRKCTLVPGYSAESFCFRTPARSALQSALGARFAPSQRWRYCQASTV